MPQNYFITGLPKAGKTTVLRELVDELRKRGLSVGGFISPDEKRHGTRTAFFVKDIRSGKKAMLASVGGDGPKVSKYHVDVKSFEGIAIPAMKRCRDCDVFVIDEIGRMEMKSSKFAKTLDYVLDSEVPLIASVSSDYLDKFAPLGEVVEVTARNRENVHARLLEASKASLKPRAKAKAKKKAPKKAARKPAKKAEKKKPSKKKPKKAKKPRKKKAAKKEKPKEAPKKEEPPKMEEKPKEKPPVHMEEHEEEPEEKKGFFGKLKDALGF